MSLTSEIKIASQLINTFPVSEELKTALIESFPLNSKITYLIRSKFLQNENNQEEDFRRYFEDKTVEKFKKNIEENKDITDKALQNLLGPMTFLTTHEVVLELVNQIEADTSTMIELKSHLIICKRLLAKEYKKFM